MPGKIVAKYKLVAYAEILRFIKIKTLIMPYKTIAVPAEIFLSYKGVNVYHAYKDDEITQPMDYWFVLYENSDFEEAFDIRDLKTWDANKTREQVLMDAIDSWEIKH